MEACRPDLPPTFESFEAVLSKLYSGYTFELAARESGIEAGVLEEVAEIVAGAGTRFAAHNWRSAAAGNLGGWQVSRSLFLVSALLGAVATEGGTFPNAWNKYVPRPPYMPAHPNTWNELTWPIEYPLAMNEMSFLLPHLLKEGRGRLEVYFTRVYNPVWTNPDGFSWIEMLKNEEKVGCYVALTPTWNETSYFADYILPMGHSSERHDLHSYEQYDGQWIAFRQPVVRAARERLGEKVESTREVNPGEVWEENELWIDLSWRIDPDGKMGIRRYFEEPDHPGEKLTVDGYYGWIFEHSVPGLPEAAAAQGLSPLEYMRRYGAFEVRKGVGRLHEEEVPAGELADVAYGPHGRVYSAAPPAASSNIVPVGSPDPDPSGRRPAGVLVDGVVCRGFPTPSGRLEFYSSTLAAWGWSEEAIPAYLRSHVHRDELGPGEKVLISTFRLPTQIHTRSANSKWLDELAHTNPVWMHPQDATEAGVVTGDLVRVTTAIGYFVAKAWVTEGIRPGVVACSHHMGRWKLSGAEASQRQVMATVSMREEGGSWALDLERGVEPFESSDPDTSRIWWTEVGVHQNMTFPVHPDPVSGMHCWHQAVRVSRAEPGDAAGDVAADIDRSHAIYEEWMERTRAADRYSPDGTRRPRWLMRPLKPGKDLFILPGAIRR